MSKHSRTSRARNLLRRSSHRAGLEPLEGRLMLSAALPQSPGSAPAIVADAAVDTVLAPGQKFSFTDANGSSVVVAYTGNAGSATIARDVPAGQQGDITSIAITGSTLKSGLNITVTAGTDKGLTTVGSITDDSPIDHIAAPGVDITGAGITFTNAGLANSITLHDLAPAAAIAEPGVSPNPVTLALADVGAGVTIALGSPASLTAVDWSGPGSVTAPWLANLSVTGSIARGLAGNFGADLNLSGLNAPNDVALPNANVTGTIDAGVWTITGAAGPLTAGGSTAAWSANISGKLASLNTAGSAAGSIAAASITTLTVGGNSSLNLDLSGAGVATGHAALVTANIINQIAAGTWTIHGSVNTITAGQTDAPWTTAIDGAVASLLVKGLAGGDLGAASLTKLVLDSDSALGLDLTGAGVATGHVTLGTTTVKGRLVGGAWNVNGDTAAITAASSSDTWTTDISGAVTTLTITGIASGNITIGSITTFKVGGQLEGATIDITAPTDPAHPAANMLGTLNVAGVIDNSRISAAGNVGTVAANAMINSQLLVGTAVGVTGLASLSTDFIFQPATHPSLTNFNIRGNVANQPSFLGSVVDAWSIDTATLKGIDTAIEPQTYGLAAHHIGSVSFRAKGVYGNTLLTLSGLNSPADLTNPNKNPFNVTFPVGSFVLQLV